ncbi:MAG: S41 family peptidase [Elusimicrobiota bacterium]|jgi:carboxyl-terminal processing protease
MKRILAVLFFLPFFVQTGVGEMGYTSFKDIRAQVRAGKGAAPVIGSIVPVKFRVEEGPVVEPAGDVLHIKDSQVAAFVQRLIDIEVKVNGVETLTDAHVDRIVDGIVAMDIRFVDPIPTERWDAILKAMGDLMEKEYGKKTGKAPSKTQDWDVLVDRMLKKAVEELKEPHSWYMDPAQVKAFREEMAGTVTGIGAGVSADPKGMKLDVIYPGSGAEAAGLLAGDVIIKVNGVPMAGHPIDDVIKRVRGDEGTTVNIQVLRNGKPMRPVKVVRKTIEQPNVFSKMAAPKIGYVYLSEFNQKSDEKVLNAMDALRAQGAKSFILDLRSDPGGLVTVVAEILSQFLSDGEAIVAFKHQGQVDSKVIAEGDGRFVEFPLVVLVDDSSASASEIMAAGIQDLRGGPVIIGSRSYGKGTQQIILPQKDGRALKITENRWYSPHDRHIDAKHDAEGNEIPGTGGVAPNISVEVPKEQAEKVMEQIVLELTGRPVPEPRVKDPVLEKAVEVLSIGAADIE